MNSYTIKNGKKLKKGYTTGSTATAAAKAATYIFFKKRKLKQVEIKTPADISLTLSLSRIQIESDYVKVGIRKDAGDDPDITDGIMILARVEVMSIDNINNDNETRIIIEGGKGVGRVTKPGLPIDVGDAAINPIPRKMIKKEVEPVLPPGKKVKICLEIPRGEELAKKTLNPELGIEGGLSILGTTGIVEPMSHQAVKDSLVVKLKQITNTNLEKKRIVLVFGNYGREKALKLGFEPENIIKMSNYVGFMLDSCVKEEIQEVIIVGHIGKLIKVAAGIFNTHSKVADARMEIMAAHVAAAGGSQEVVMNIMEATTTEAALKYVKRAGLLKIFDKLSQKISKKAENYVKNKLEVKTLLFSMEEGILASYGLGSEGFIDE